LNDAHRDDGRCQEGTEAPAKQGVDPSGIGRFSAPSGGGPLSRGDCGGSADVPRSDKHSDKRGDKLTETDPDLAEVRRDWDRLSDAAQADIMAIVRTCALDEG